MDAHRARFGVVPICRAVSAHGVPIAPRTYWARRSRPPSRRALADAAVTEILAGIYEPDARGRRPAESLYGSLKVWAHLRRQGVGVARCTVERLMRAHGWRGVTRARKVRTTVPDPAHGRAPDLVNRDFGAERARAAARGGFYPRAAGRRPGGLHGVRRRRLRRADRRLGVLAVQGNRVRGAGDPAGRRPARQARAPDRRGGPSPTPPRGASPLA